VVSAIPIPGLPTHTYSNSFSICQPVIPLAPTLGAPARFSQVSGQQTTVFWTDFHNVTDSCTPYYTASEMDETYTYNIYTSPTTSFTGASVYSTTVDRSGPIQFGYNLTNMTSGSLYWMIAVTKKVVISSTVMNSLTQDSVVDVFSVCVSSAPNVPMLVAPLNGTAFARCNITTDFQWVRLLTSDFGIDCSSNPVSQLSIFYGTDPTNLGKLTDFLPYEVDSGLTSLIGAGDDISPNTLYYWQVVVSNSQYSTGSAIWSFTTPDTSLTACSGHGTCNNDGTCACSYGFAGADCATVVPTTATPTEAGEGSNKAGIPIGEIAGPVAGGLFLVLLLMFVAFFVLRRRLQNELEKPVRPPPNFPPLAFTVPFGFPPLATEKIVPWYSFEQLLVVYGFALPFAILDVTQDTEIDDVVKCLVYIIESHGQGANFVKALITKDLREKREAGTLSAATLFRDNSFASKAFKIYSKIVGLPYLFYIFGDAVYDLCTNDLAGEPAFAPIDTGTKKRRASTRAGTNIELQQVVVRVHPSGTNSLLDAGSFEMDPNKMTENDDGLVNAIFLQLKCQKLLVKLFRSSAIFPSPLGGIFKHLMAEVEGNLSRDDGYKAIAAFLFLRLVNPSILFPNQYGLTDSAPNNPALTRQLILITKVLQNLANGVYFGDKEQHMIPLNDVIDSNRGVLRDFVDTITTLTGEQDGQAQNEPAKSNVVISFPLSFSALNFSPPPPSLPSLATGALPAAFSFAQNVIPTKKGQKEVKDEEDFFKTLEVPRPIVESSLTLVYNQFYRNRDRVLDTLKKHRSADDVKIISNKCGAIVDNIGEPINRNATGTTMTMKKDKDKERD